LKYLNFNEAIDGDKDAETRKHSTVIEFGNTEGKVLFEGDKEVYLQSEKGVKLMKPEPEFFRLLNNQK
jgi:hypothetical protein